MSLLIDALKAAETGIDRSDTPRAPFSLAKRRRVVFALPPARSTLPDLAQHRDTINAELAAHSKAAAADGLTQKAVHTRRSPAPTDPALARRRPYFSRFVALACLLAVAGGAYFRAEVVKPEGGDRRPPPPKVRRTTPPAPPQGKEVPRRIVAVVSPTGRAASAPPAAETPKASTQAPAPTKVDFAVRPSALATRTGTAYAALIAGDVDRAQNEYQLVLQEDARNLDSLLGLATIHARRGQRDHAKSFYQLALAVDALDATAQAGLNALADDPVDAENRLRSAVAQQPAAAGFHFALGHVLARDGRWNEAQQAYFHAYALDPANADYCFNLAVSLDHLRQSRASFSCCVFRALKKTRQKRRCRRRTPRSGSSSNAPSGCSSTSCPPRSPTG